MLSVLSAVRALIWHQFRVCVFFSASLTGPDRFILHHFPRLACAGGVKRIARHDLPLFPALSLLAVQILIGQANLIKQAVIPLADQIASAILRRIAQYITSPASRTPGTSASACRGSAGALRPIRRLAPHLGDQAVNVLRDELQLLPGRAAKAGRVAPAAPCQTRKNLPDPGCLARVVQVAVVVARPARGQGRGRSSWRRPRAPQGRQAFFVSSA